MKHSVAVLAVALSSASVAAQPDSPAPAGDEAPRAARASPVVVRPLDPSYPPKSLRLDQQGTVTVRMYVDRDGVPTDCRIVATSGHPDLDRATCEKMLMTRYAPPTDEFGEGIEITFTQAIRWMFDPPLPAPSDAPPAR